MIQNKIPTKLKDPGSFSISFLIRSMPIDCALCDLGSSVSFMPFLCVINWRRDKANYYLLIIGELFYEISYVHFRGYSNKSSGFMCTSRLRDPRNGGGYTNPHHSWETILSHRRCCIDMKNGTLSFDVGDDHGEFNLLKVGEFPSISDECNKIDVLDGLIWETVSNINSNDPLEHLMLNNSTIKDENPEVAKCAQLLEASLLILFFAAKVESL